ncbi:MAG: 50S ribosomal protein L6 [Sphingobacteriales bacterium]|jgi:large subunit ribosomal protein L6|nr:50S ribosomal protein L6 [Sphingobacteriales bacterium]MCC6583432.1 50S ribosomal protein L6 [Chitinophagales bacterium]HNY54759.1 50S ribosomal protein L6 [Chitinophagales bacterium]
MSRVGKLPITIPAKTEVNVADNNVVTVKGPKGTLTEKVDRDIIVKVEDGKIVLERPTEQKRHKALHGLYRSLVNNMVVGASEGFKKTLDVVGVGFRASNQGQLLELSIGFSHPIYVMLPDEIKVTTETVKGQPPRIILESTDKQLIGQVAAKIRSLRKPEPYKGKGIKYTEEILRKKAGKSAGKK